MHHAEPHQVSAMPKPDKILKLDGISPESVEAHWGLYEAYVKKYNEVMEKLPGADRAAANQIYSDYRGLREMLTFAIGVSEEEAEQKLLRVRELPTRLVNGAGCHGGPPSQWEIGCRTGVDGIRWPSRTAPNQPATAAETDRAPRSNTR